MKIFKIVFLIILILIYAYFFSQIDYKNIFAEISKNYNLISMCLLLWAAYFILDTLNWQIVAPFIPQNINGLFIATRVRICGEFFSYMIPAGGNGGEAVKILLLKYIYKWKTTDILTSLILTKTTNVISLTITAMFVLFLVFTNNNIPNSLKYSTLCGLIFSMALVSLFIYIQFSTFIYKYKPKTVWLKSILNKIQETSSTLKKSYKILYKNIILATISGIAVCVIGSLRVYVIANALNANISLYDAMIIDISGFLIRSLIFFIPSGLGTQDATIFYLTKIITNNDEIALVTVAILRITELIWIIFSAIISTPYIKIFAKIK